jgi:hypothetical protein
VLRICSRDIPRHGVVSVGGRQPPFWLSGQAGDNATSDSHQSWDGTFSALARDYRETTKGRTLVVIRMDSGSIIATLTDAAIAAARYAKPAAEGGHAVITAINALATFAENLKKWFGYAKSDTDKNRLYRKGKKSPGQLSVEQIVKTAANTGSHLRMKYNSEKGESLEVELTPAEAISARERRLAPDAARKGRRRPLAIDSEDLALPQTNERLSRGLQAMIDEHLQRIAAQDLSPTEVHVIITALLAAGAGHLLPRIVSALEARGHHKIAQAFRQYIHLTTHTRKLPPTTTT